MLAFTIMETPLQFTNTVTCKPGRVVTTTILINRQAHSAVYVSQLGSEDSPKLATY